MIKKILIILWHPARERQSFCEALALAYQTIVIDDTVPINFAIPRAWLNMMLLATN